MKKKFVSTVYGHAIILADFGCMSPDDNVEYYQLRLSENSLVPGAKIAVYPKELCSAMEDHSGGV